MKHYEILNQVKPGSTIYSFNFDNIIDAKYKSTEVHTSYTGERTYYTVLEQLPSHTIWVDHSQNEWFMTKKEAIEWGIKQLNKRINEWQTTKDKLKTLL